MTEQHLGATRIAGPDVCRRVLLVGELNPYGADPDYALYHEPAISAGGRLQRTILGLPARHWYLPLWRVNLCSETGAWAFEEATTRARALMDAEAPWHVLVLLGQKVRMAFPDPLPAMFGALAFRVPGATRTIVCLPHPSGRNPIWRDHAVIDRARAVLRQAIPEIPWGSLEAS